MSGNARSHLVYWPEFHSWAWADGYLFLVVAHWDAVRALGRIDPESTLDHGI